MTPKPPGLRQISRATADNSWRKKKAVPPEREYFFADNRLVDLLWDRADPVEVRLVYYVTRHTLAGKGLPAYLQVRIFNLAEEFGCSTTSLENAIRRLAEVRILDVLRVGTPAVYGLRVLPENIEAVAPRKQRAHAGGAQ